MAIFMGTGTRQKHFYRMSKAIDGEKVLTQEQQERLLASLVRSGSGELPISKVKKVIAACERLAVGAALLNLALTEQIELCGIDDETGELLFLYPHSKRIISDLDLEIGL